MIKIMMVFFMLMMTWTKTMMTQVRKKSRFVAVKEVEKALVEGIWKLVHILFLITIIMIIMINMTIIVLCTIRRSR